MVAGPDRPPPGKTWSLNRESRRWRRLSCWPQERGPEATLFFCLGGRRRRGAGGLLGFACGTLGGLMSGVLVTAASVASGVGLARVLISLAGGALGALVGGVLIGLERPTAGSRRVGCRRGTGGGRCAGAGRPPGGGGGGGGAGEDGAVAQHAGGDGAKAGSACHGCADDGQFHAIHTVFSLSG